MFFKLKNLTQTEISFSREMSSLLLFFEKNYATLKNRAICAAVSGGSDSLSLLILLKKWSEQHDWKLYCCTVDHRLRKESLDEALYVKSICEKFNIEHVILHWEHDSIDNEGKLENLAREARYDLIQKFCEEKSIPLVATGHNWNDQIETCELRKNAGSSEFGLAGMSQIRTLSEHLKIVRPLLHFSKKFLENFLKSQNIEWKVDPMNFQDTFQRVVARKKIQTYSPQKIEKISKIIRIYGEIRYEIERQKRNFSKSNANIWDNRFLIKLKLTKNQYIYSSEREFNVTIPYDILVGFPCLYEGGRAKYDFGEWAKFVKFIRKPDLFDVYCGVNFE